MIPGDCLGVSSFTEATVTFNFISSSRLKVS